MKNLLMGWTRLSFSYELKRQEEEVRVRMHLVEDKAWLSRKLRRTSNAEAVAAGADEADE